MMENVFFRALVQEIAYEGLNVFNRLRKQNKMFDPSFPHDVSYLKVKLAYGQDRRFYAIQIKGPDYFKYCLIEYLKKKK